MIKYIYLEWGLFFCAFFVRKGFVKSTIPWLREAINARTGKKIGGAEVRVKITLACTECKQRNYNTMKNKKNDPDRLEMNKYCRFCKKHTLHKETK